MAKVADVFGRLEAYSLAIFTYVLGYILMASSRDVHFFTAAQVFYSAGGTAVQILQQIFIADTSDILNRAIFSTLPDVPFLWTAPAGPPIAQRMAAEWRWGYGLWAIVVPACFLPLALSLFLNERKAKKQGYVKPKDRGPITAARVGRRAKQLFYDIDAIGIVLITLGFVLVLVPLTIATKQKAGWKSPAVIAMLVLGPLCLIAFPFCEARAPHPLVPLGMLKSRTFCCSCALGFFYFAAFYMSVQPYFNSYLLVVKNQSIKSAGWITQAFSLTATVASVLVSLAIKYTRRYKYFVVAGSLVYMMGLGLMIRYRTEESSIGSIVGAQICMGIGGGTLNPAAQLGAQISVSHQEVAAATAVFLVAVEIGGAVGAAIAGAIWTKMVPSRLALYLPEESKSQATAIFNSVTVAANAFPVGTLERAAINRAYQDAMRVLLIVAICTTIPVLPLALAMKNYKLDKIKQQVKGRVIGGRINENGEKVHDGWKFMYKIFRKYRIFGKKKDEEVVIVLREREVGDPGSPTSLEGSEARHIPTQEMNATKD